MNISDSTSHAHRLTDSTAPVHRYWFASDNVAGITPEAQAGLLSALTTPDIAAPYGEDATTAQARAHLHALFETDCAVHFVATGTAANALALAAMCDSYHSVITHAAAHIQTDECNAPEFFRPGLKLQTVEGPRGKLDVSSVARLLARESDVHFSPFGALSLTQMTELGGLYTPAEVAALAQLAHAHGLHVHMDGARLANALAALDATPADLTWRAGVDILCFGGTKQGMPATEAILIFRPELARNFAYRIKQAGQLLSKMRVLSGPWLGMLEARAWLRHARHANAAARQLAQALAQFPQLRLLEPVNGNVVFVEMPPGLVARLHAQGWHFYPFTDRHHRLMCSWATTPAQIETFIAAVRANLHALA